VIHDARNQLAVASALAGGWGAPPFFPSIQAKAIPIDVITGFGIGGKDVVLTLRLDTAVTDVALVGFSLVSTNSPNGALTDLNRKIHWSSFDPALGGVLSPAAGTEWVARIPSQQAFPYLQLIAFATAALTTGSVTALWSMDDRLLISVPDAIN